MDSEQSSLESDSLTPSAEALSNDLDNYSVELWSAVEQLHRVLDLPSDLETVALEGFRQSIEAILKWISELFSKLLKKLSEFADYLFSSTTELKFKLSTLETHVNALDGRTLAAHEHVPFGYFANMMSTEYGPPRDPHQYIRNLMELDNQFKNIQSRWTLPAMNVIDTFNESITRALQDQTTVGDLAMVNSRTLGVINPAYVLAGFSRTSTFPDGSGDRSAPPLLGQCCLRVHAETGTREISDPLAQARSIQQTHVQLVRSHTVAEIPPTAAMEVMTPSEMHEILHLCHTLLDHLTNNEVRQTARRIKRIRDYTDTHISSDHQGHISQESSAMLHYATTYAAWLEQPYLGLLSRMESSIRGAIILLKKHVAAYQHPST